MTVAKNCIDVWFCDRCQREWRVKSLPHNPSCPKCGRIGFWRRFEHDEQPPLLTRANERAKLA